MTEFLSRSTAPDPLTIRSTAAPSLSGREPIKHLLIGSPQAVRTTIHRLHQLRYADPGLWSTLLALPASSTTSEAQPIILTPNPGDVMSILVRYLQLEP